MDKPYLALCRIKRNPEGRMRHTGKYDAQGDPIMRSDSQVTMPGSIIMLEPSPELDSFLEHDAVRELEPGEMALWKRGHTAFPLDPRPIFTEGRDF